MSLTKRSVVLLAGFAGFACRALGTVGVECAECASGLLQESAAGEEDASLMQIRSASAVSCNRKSLIVAPPFSSGISVDEADTFLQWNLQLMSQGAPFAEFANVSDIELELVTPYGKPAFGIVLLQISFINVQTADEAKLLAYLEAGGLLVVADNRGRSGIQINALMEALNSSIRLDNLPNNGTLSCSTAEDPPYAPVKSPTSCHMMWHHKLTQGVTGLQGQNIAAIVDDEDSSVALFAERRDPSYVVARAEKKRRLVVIGNDEPVADACATDSDNQAFAFGVTTNLRFFSNLYNHRCMKL